MGAERSACNRLASLGRHALTESRKEDARLIQVTADAYRIEERLQCPSAPPTRDRCIDHAPCVACGRTALGLSLRPACSRLLLATRATVRTPLQGTEPGNGGGGEALLKVEGYPLDLQGYRSGRNLLKLDILRHLLQIPASAPMSSPTLVTRLRTADQQVPHPNPLYMSPARTRRPAKPHHLYCLAVHQPLCVMSAPMLC